MTVPPAAANGRGNCNQSQPGLHTVSIETIPPTPAYRIRAHFAPCAHCRVPVAAGLVDVAVHFAERPHSPCAGVGGADTDYSAGDVGGDDHPWSMDHTDPYIRTLLLLVGMPHGMCAGYCLAHSSQQQAVAQKSSLSFYPCQQQAALSVVADCSGLFRRRAGRGAVVA